MATDGGALHYEDPGFRSLIRYKDWQVRHFLEFGVVDTEGHVDDAPLHQEIIGAALPEWPTSAGYCHLITLAQKILKISEEEARALY